MNKWTWLALLAFVGILGGSYYLLTQPKGKVDGEGGKPGEEMDVEDFDSADDGDAKGDNTYDMLDDPDASQSGATGPDAGAGDKGAAAAKPGPTDPSKVETIDDEEDAGETVKDPVVIEDNDESVEAAKPKGKP